MSISTRTEFDALVAGIELVEAALSAHPDWASDEAVALLDQVAGGASAGGDVAHPTPMLSLKKAKTLAEVEAFIESVGSLKRVIFEPKLDGLAVRAVYTEGVLTQMVTRGDGLTGEDITNTGRIINGLPSRVEATASFEVRGEVYMSAEDFKVANEIRLADGDEPFKNSRNAVAGVLRKGDTRFPLQFAAYSMSSGELTVKSHQRRLVLLSHYGFRTVHALSAPYMLSPRDTAETVEKFGAERASVDFPTDGIVITADGDADRARLGTGSRAPRYALAYKYEAETATTVVEDIELAVGRTGRLSIRARVTPVEVGGTTITYASGHNVGWMQRNDIRVGDTVRIQRANDVIPYIDSPDLTLRPANSTPWIAPTGCPDCGEPFDTSTELWRCTTAECSTLGRIVYAASRDCLDIEGMRTAIATALVESGKVTTIADLFTLSADDLAAVAMGQTSTGNTRLLGATVAGKIIAEIEKAKSQPLNRVITSLGLRKTGRTMGRRLAAAFPTMEALRSASVADLCGVEGIADGKARSIHSELASMGAVIDALAAAGVNMGAAAPAGDALTGMKVVVTGKVTGPLEGLSRNEVNELIEANGGKPSGSVSSSTSLLVCSEPGSSKHAKAVTLGVPIVTPEEFAQMVGRA